MNGPPLLELRGIVKSFGSVQALCGADFVLVQGEVHALLGENGAGKSTMMHVAYGMLSPDQGELKLRGQRVRLRSARDARARGIGVVHQHFASIGALNVAENLRLAAGPERAKSNAPSREGAESLAGSLSVALRQRLEIAMALASDPDILLLDEPTAALTPSEVAELLVVIKAFAASGKAVALITHKLPEVIAAADRVTVLRGGRVTLTSSAPGITADELAQAMIGPLHSGTSAVGSGTRGAPGSEAIIRIENILIKSGELIGLAAVEGNGQRELLRSIAGLEPPREAVTISANVKVGFVPEDRTNEGLIPPMSITENVVLGQTEDPRWRHGARLDWSAARLRTSELIADFAIRAPGPDTVAAHLSGGNQQRVVLARVLEGSPRIVVAENPTRGLDFRATRDLHQRLQEAASAGAAVLVYSTDLDEVLELGERVLVVHRSAVKEAPQGADREAVGRMMLGLPADSPARSPSQAR